MAAHHHSDDGNHSIPAIDKNVAYNPMLTPYRLYRMAQESRNVTCDEQCDVFEDFAHDLAELQLLPTFEGDAFDGVPFKVLERLPEGYNFKQLCDELGRVGS